MTTPENVYIWDGMTNKIRRWEGEDKYEHEDEWLFHSLLQNGVVVRRRVDRYALETWANDSDEAHRKFLKFPPYARTHR